jgi:hypothetical protein
MAWINIDNKKPRLKVPTVCVVQHWNTKRLRHALLKRVNEGDCNWRTVDDNSELSYNWNVIYWSKQKIPKLPKLLKTK